MIRIDISGQPKFAKSAVAVLIQDVLASQGLLTEVNDDSYFLAELEDNLVEMVKDDTKVEIVVNRYE